MLAFVIAVSASRSGRQADTAEHCITQIARGERRALAQLYEQTHAAVYGFALSILKNRQDAEDVLQDTYVQIWNAAGSYAAAGKPMAWIFTITRNLALMRLREGSRTVPVAPEDWQALFSDEPAVDPADGLMLKLLMETLSDGERQVVMLHVMTGLKHREIADLLGLRLSTVLSRYSRALKKLDQAWKEAD